jgi:hypothetical protein
LTGLRSGATLARSFEEVRVLDGKVLLDGKVVDDASKVQRPGDRLDGLLFALRPIQKGWENAHPGREYPGVVGLHLEARLPFKVAAAVVGASGWAGHPHAAIAVRDESKPSRLGRLSVEAFRQFTPEDNTKFLTGKFDMMLSLEVQADGIRALWWRVGGGDDASAVAPVDIPSLVPGSAGVRERLGKIIDEQWHARGSHQATSDRSFDWAAVRGPNDISLQTAVEVIDALYEVKRDWTLDGNVQRVPAFKVMFGDATAP